MAREVVKIQSKYVLALKVKEMHLKNLMPTKEKYN
jgi:hypothetical protein